MDQAVVKQRNKGNPFVGVQYIFYHSTPIDGLKEFATIAQYGNRTYGGGVNLTNLTISFPHKLLRNSEPCSE